MTQGLIGDQPYHGGGPPGQEVLNLEHQLNAALRRIKITDSARTLLQVRSCYAIIGLAGAGKTTALLYSGLKFVQALDMDSGALPRAEGSRASRWWVGKQAVLIETTGYRIGQDVLGVLKMARPSRPLNGLIVAIALDGATAVQNGLALMHARSIRQRVTELRTQVGIRIPTYIIFTKVDLVAGFAEFFAGLDSSERSQVWGMTFDPAANRSELAKIFSEQFQALIWRLETSLFKRLQIERNLKNRTLIAMFPGEFSGLEPALAGFLATLLGSVDDHSALLLRGLYFTSATQEGTPVGRLTGTVARSFGLESPELKAARAAPGQSYFLVKPIQEIVFGGPTPPMSPEMSGRQAFVRLASFAVSVSVVIAVNGLFWHLRNAEVREINTSIAAVEAFDRAVSAVRPDRVSDSDLRSVAPLLDEARTLPFGNDDAAGRALGFSQSAKRGAAARGVYRHALERILLPRIMFRLRSQMRDSVDRPDALYDPTLVYLMLDGDGPIDRAFVRRWLESDWLTLYPDDKFTRLRDSLSEHLAALLTDQLPPGQMDRDLVAVVRGALARVSAAQRGYSLIRRSAAAQQVAPWRPSEVLGPVGIPLFVRPSGEPTSSPIPGFYTVDGFQNVLLPCLGAITQIAAEQNAIVKPHTEISPGTSQIAAIEQNIILLYENDYARTWDGLLADLSVVPLRSIFQAAQDLYIQASPKSPMRALVASIARQLTLSGSLPTRPPSQGGGTQATIRACPATDVIVAEPVPRSLEALPWPPGREIDERYGALRQVVGSGPGAPIDGVLRSLNEMAQQFAKAAAASAGIGVLAGTGDPTPALRAEALHQPEPLARWLVTFANSGAALRAGGFRP